MAIGLIKNNTVIGIEEEVTEGTYVAPSAATSYIQPLADGWEIVPVRPNLERDILDASIGVALPRKGIKSSTGQLPVEFRASGVEGAATDFDSLLKGAFGAVRSIATNITTKVAGNTGTVLQIEDADIASFNVGDVLVVKEPGAHQFVAITAKVSTIGAATITVIPSHQPSGSFSSPVTLSKTRVYYPANTGHPALSVSYYLANEMRVAGIGMKVGSMSVDNFVVGQLAALNFGLEGINYSFTDGVAPHTPTFDSGLPPTILNACLFLDGVEYKINQFGLNLANTIAPLTDTCSATGRDKLRVSRRIVTGTINPFMDDTTTTLMDLLTSGASFSMFISVATPSGVAGEFLMGSGVGIWLPGCIVSEEPFGDVEGILTNNISFQATRGGDGSSGEIFMGFV